MGPWIARSPEQECWIHPRDFMLLAATSANRIFLENVLRGLIKLRVYLFGLQVPGWQAVGNHPNPGGFLRPAVDEIEEECALTIVPAHRGDRSSIQHKRIDRIDHRLKLGHRLSEYPDLNLKIGAIGKLRHPSLR